MTNENHPQTCLESVPFISISWESRKKKHTCAKYSVKIFIALFATFYPRTILMPLNFIRSSSRDADEPLFLLLFSYYILFES
jgi:hypothetical protein